MATSVKLLCIILLFQLNSTLAATAGSSTEDRHMSPTQSTQSNYSFSFALEGPPGLTKSVSAKWQGGAYRFILKTVTSLQHHFHKRGKRIVKDQHFVYRPRPQTHWRKSSDDITKPRKEPYHNQSSAFFGLLNSSPYAAFVDPPSESFLSLSVKVTPKPSSKQASSISQSTSKASTVSGERTAQTTRNLSSSHHAPRKFSRATATVGSGLTPLSSQKILPLKRPGTPTALSAIPLYSGRRAAWRFRRSFLNLNTPQYGNYVLSHHVNNVRQATLQRSTPLGNIQINGPGILT